MRSPRHGLLLLFSFFAAAANAHRLSPAYFGLQEIEAGRYAAQWKVSISGGLADSLEPQVPEGCTVDGRVRSYVVDDARLMHAELQCGPLAGRVFTVTGLAATDTDVLLRIDRLDGTSFTHRLVPEAPSVVIPAEPGALEVIATYLEFGIEHILLGIDHLLFVLALLLFVRGIKRLVLTITAFTLAHSITLAAATLGFVAVPVAPIEATIALSILFVATELARSFGRSEPRSRELEDREQSSLPHEQPTLAARFPWLIAFAFGLLHGLGFAGALTEVGLPAQAIPLALLFFNVGVEIGQLAFIAVVLGGAKVLEQAGVTLPAWSSRLAVYSIGTVAAFWVFERTLTAI